MARRLKRRKKTTTAIATRERDTPKYIASTPLYPPLLRVVNNDRRLFSPGPTLPSRLDGSPARLIVKPTKSKKLPYQIAFAKPRGVTLCVRRTRRRETLFALKRTGKGSRAPRRHRNEWSTLKC